MDAAQETRLQRLETIYTSTSGQLGRQDAVLESLGEALTRVEDALSGAIGKLDGTLDRLQEQTTGHAKRIATLEAQEHDRKARVKAVIRWGGGVLATVAAALLLALLGMK
jgi:hypothetical protein